MEKKERFYEAFFEEMNGNLNSVEALIAQ